MRKFILSSTVFSFLVFAGEIPEALPEGFLEQLPIMSQLNDDEYLAMMEFAKRNPAGSGMENREASSEENKDEN